jgi:hypothetical protein
MRLMTKAWVFGGLAALAAAGCSSSGGTCSNAPACGGSVVGTWTITSSCVSANASMLDSQCPTETANSSGLNVTGTVTYNADGTYTSTSTLSGTISVNLPQSCLTTNGVTVTCDQLNQVFQSNPTPGLTLSCTGSTGCTCTETLANQTSNETGTYTTTAAGLLTETPAGGTASLNDYCVKGTTMTQSPHSESGMMMGQSVSGTITLTKN